MSPQAHPTICVYCIYIYIRDNDERKASGQTSGCDKIVLNKTYIHTYIDEMDSGHTHVPFPFLLVHSMFLTITRFGSSNMRRSLRNPEATNHIQVVGNKNKKRLYIHFNQIDSEDANLH